MFSCEMFWDEMFSSRSDIAGNGTYPTFEEMVFVDGKSTQINERWAAVDRSIYHKHLKHWLRIFPRKHVSTNWLWLHKYELPVKRTLKLQIELISFLEMAGTYEWYYGDSLNAGSVMGTLRSGGDTTWCNQIHLNSLHSEMQDTKTFSLCLLLPPCLHPVQKLPCETFTSWYDINMSNCFPFSD